MFVHGHGPRAVPWSCEVPLVSNIWLQKYIRRVQAGLHRVRSHLELVRALQLMVLMYNNA